jgi:hypothetical protein
MLLRKSLSKTAFAHATPPPGARSLHRTVDQRRVVALCLSRAITITTQNLDSATELYQGTSTALREGYGARAMTSAVPRYAAVAAAAAALGFLVLIALVSSARPVSKTALASGFIPVRVVPAQVRFFV